MKKTNSTTTNISMTRNMRRKNRPETRVIRIRGKFRSKRPRLVLYRVKKSTLKSNIRLRGRSLLNHPPTINPSLRLPPKLHWSLPQSLRRSLPQSILRESNPRKSRRPIKRNTPASKSKHQRSQIERKPVMKNILMITRRVALKMSLSLASFS